MHLKQHSCFGLHFIRGVYDQQMCVCVCVDERVECFDCDMCCNGACLQVATLHATTFLFSTEFCIGFLEIVIFEVGDWR